MQICTHQKVAGFDLKLEQYADGRFKVTYGAQAWRGLTYGAAARQYGECLMHGLACEGNLNNDQE